MNGFFSGNEREELKHIKASIERAELILQDHTSPFDGNSYLDNSLVPRLRQLQGRIDSMISTPSTSGSSVSETKTHTMGHGMSSDRPSPGQLEAQRVGQDHDIWQQHTDISSESAYMGLKKRIASVFRWKAIFKQSRARSDSSAHQRLRSHNSDIQQDSGHTGTQYGTMTNDQSHGEGASNEEQSCSKSGGFLGHIFRGIFGHGRSPRQSFSSSGSSDGRLPVVGLSRVMDKHR